MITQRDMATYTNFFLRFSFGFHRRLFGGFLFKNTIQHGRNFQQSVQSMAQFHKISIELISSDCTQQLLCYSDDTDMVACERNNAITATASSMKTKTQRNKNGSRKGEK
jgi:thiol:disulfide interchange protein